MQWNDKVKGISEMGTEARNQFGKGNVLTISVVLVVLLSISNAWFLYTNQSLQNQVSTLETENSDFREQIGTLQSQNTNLQSQISNFKDQLQSQEDYFQSQVDALQTENNRLQNEIEALKAPQLHKVDVQWADHQRYPSPYISIEGSIFNSGSESAYNTILTVRIFDSVSALLKSEEIHLGTVAGKSYNVFNVDIQYSGRADSVTTTITYD